MAGGARQNDDMITDINVTPFVDVMLVLLIIFMLTTDVITDKMKNPAIQVELPKAASADKTPARPLSIVINKQSELFLNGREATRAEIAAFVTGELVRQPALEAVVSADERLSHGEVVGVIDYIRLLGVHNVAINTKRQEIE